MLRLRLLEFVVEEEEEEEQEEEEEEEEEQPQQHGFGAIRLRARRPGAVEQYY